METLCIVSCAASAWAATYVALGGSRSVGWKSLVGVVLRQLVRLARRVGLSWVADELMRVPSVTSLCEAMVVWAERQGYVMSARDACGVGVIAFAASLPTCALLARSPMGMAVPPLVCAMGLPLWEARRKARRAQELASEMPGVFRTLALALGSGETLAQAVTYVGDHERGEAGRAFRRASLRMSCGMSAQEALELMRGELDAPGVGLLVTALLISQRTGSPLRSLFQRSAALVERQGEFERLLSVKTAQVRLSVRIVCLLPVVMVALLSMVSPDFQHGLLTPAGIASVLMAALMDLVALGIIRHLMSGVL